jgi:RHS repeat-associated protein
LIEEKIDADGDGDIDHETCYAYDGNSIVLQFDKDGSGSLDTSNLSHRYTWQPDAVDQLMADEQVHFDNQQDLVYDSFGNLESQTNSSIVCLIRWTGRPFSVYTGLQNNLNRWYDPIVAGWISQDPIGFKSGTTNLYCYCGNSPTNIIDYTGLGPFDWWPHWDDLRYFYYCGWSNRFDKDINQNSNRFKNLDDDLRKNRGRGGNAGVTPPVNAPTVGKTMETLSEASHVVEGVGETGPLLFPPVP